jgi:hypothetical protein
MADEVIFRLTRADVARAFNVATNLVEDTPLPDDVWARFKGAWESSGGAEEARTAMMKRVTEVLTAATGKCAFLGCGEHAVGAPNKNFPHISVCDGHRSAKVFGDCRRCEKPFASDDGELKCDAGCDAVVCRQCGDAGRWGCEECDVCLMFFSCQDTVGYCHGDGPCFGERGKYDNMCNECATQPDEEDDEWLCPKHYADHERDTGGDDSGDDEVEHATAEAVSTGAAEKTEATPLHCARLA